MPRPANPAKRGGAADRDLLIRIRDRFKVMSEADETNRTAAMEDLKFLHVAGAQWDDTVKRNRGARPCYEFNKLKIKAKRLINDMRGNRPQGKVRAVEDGDKDTADVYEGLCRNIWNVSDGDTICDYAGEYQVGCGMGAWRVETKYNDDSAFEQDIVITAIKNPFCLYGDPGASDPMKRDGEDWILTEKIKQSVYEKRWPNAKEVDFGEVDFDDDAQWSDGEFVRVCEYHYHEEYEKTILLTQDGKSLDATDPAVATLPPGSIIRSRVAKCNRVMMCIASGDAILEGPTELAGKYHRFIMIPGEWIVIDGKVHWHGLVRNAKDAQRRYNVAQTAITEAIASAPQSKYWATPKMAEGNLKDWAVAHNENLPYLLANADPQMPGFPQRMGGPDVPIALMQEAVIADQDLKDTTGVYDPAIGAKSNETSGIALTKRAEQTEMVNFNYPDNMAKGIKRTWEIMIDLIPFYYDTERSVRILGVDGAEKYVKVNQSTVDPQTGQMVVANDLSRGKFDVTVMTGPSFATQRQEAAETYTMAGQQFPGLWTVAGDLIFKSMDLPYAEQIAERMRTMLPPPIQQMLKEGKPLPPEVTAAMSQVEQAMQHVQQLGQMVQAGAQEAEKAKSEAETAQANVRTEIAQLDTKKAQFQAYVAEQMAKVSQAEAKFAADAADTGNAEERANLANQLAEAVTGIQQQAAQFMQQAVATIAEVQSRMQPVVMPAPPRPRVVKITRQNGELIPLYEDQLQPQAPATVQ